MVEAEQEWVLPIPEGVDVNQNELLLLDWCLCGASRILPVIDLESLVTPWHMLRMGIWECMAELKAKSSQLSHLALTDDDAKILLAICPTTFRWGTGEDCGYILKTKLAQMLLKKGAVKK